MSAAVSHPPSSSSRWAIRPGNMGDASGIVALWLEEATPARFAGQMTPKEYMRRHKPRIIEILDRPATSVVVACDPELAESMWGFGVVEGDDVVHLAVVKRAFRRATDGGGAIMRDLIGDRLTKPQWYTHDLMGLRRCGVIAWNDRARREELADGTPLAWRWDPWARAGDGR